MITLALDACTYRGTVAVFEGNRLLSDGSVAMRGREAERLMPAVDAALVAAGVTVADVGRIVCGAGPGSFTSLRIAASIAKGIAVGRGIPLYAVSSLALIVAANVRGGGAGETYVARLDALRGESYVGAFEHADQAVVLTRDVQLVANGVVEEWAGTARVVGPAEPDPWHPHVLGLPRVPWALEEPVNLAGWEPTYGRLAEAQVKWEATHGRALRS